jgi:LysR family glycine cleavage system transcriptional activator
VSRQLPPLNPLRMFEASGRHVSFTRAAEELGVTQAAVSRQVAVLEGFLKVKLFARHHSELQLTDTGRRYLAAVSQALATIEESTANVRRVDAKPVLRLRSYPTFARHWLIPRLSRFSAKHPDIEVRLSTAVALADFEHENLDLCVQFGEGTWEGLTAWKLMPDAIAPVCSRALLDGPKPLRQVQDLERHTLLHSRYRRSDWADWLAFAGGKIDPSHGPVFDSSTLTYQAAMGDIGVAIGQICLLERELASGDLVLPFDKILRRSLGYYLVHPKRAGGSRKVIAFREWIIGEAKAAN